MHRPSFGVVFVSAIGAVLFLTPPVEGQRPSRLERQTVDGRDVVAREVLVKFRSSLQPSDLVAIGAQTDAEDVKRIGRAGALRLRSRSMSAAALLAQLARRDDVAYAEPNYIIDITTTPDDPRFSELWGLDSIQAPAAWDLSVGSTANVVAVIDTGIDYTHEDLAANMWSAPAAFTVDIDGQAVTCAAGTHGFNAIARTCDPMDDNNHGTHVSGTIGAAGNNGIGVAGVNWTTQLMGIKFLDAEGSGTIADAIDAVEFAITVKQAFAATGGANIRVLSNSWGGPGFSQALLDQINAANDADMLFVAAAGNSGTDNGIIPFYPATFDAPGVVSVASSGPDDDKSSFSNYGASSVDVAAPGELILSTTIGSTYGSFSGTSMATPHVSGAAALVLSLCAIDTVTLKDTLLSTVDPLPPFESVTVSGGRLNVNSALHACTAPPDIPMNLAARGGDARVTLSWSAAAGAMRYNVRRSLTAGGPYTLVAEDVKGTAYGDTAVVNGTTYYYVVSAENSLGESGDSNEAPATPATPSDLLVFSLTAPATAGPGSTVAISVTTKNQGAGLAQPSTTRIYLSANTTLDVSDVALWEQPVPELPSGAPVTASASLVIPEGTPVGRHYLIAKADADGALDESNESNNSLSRAIQVGPDLQIVVFTVPAAGASGATISVTDTTANQGGGAAAVSRTIFYLSVNGTVGVGDVLLAARDVPSLAAGATGVGTTTLTIPADTAVGLYFIVARADGEDAIPETTETNNVLARTMMIGGDLVVSALTVPPTGAAGAPIVVTDTTKNPGGGAVPASVTRFFLSANLVLDANDTPLAGGRDVPLLNPGATSVGATTLTIPSATGSGAHYIVAKADADASVAETYETNNTTFRLIQIGNDLVVSTFVVPAKAGAGATVTVMDTTANQGAGAAAASITRFYLSVNSAWDGGDAPLNGSRQIPDLAAGTNAAGSTSLIIPSTTATGSYFLIAKADADQVVQETSESNNVLARAIQIGGDLVVSTFTAPAKGGAGAPMVVSDTTTNQGAGPVGGTVTTFYFSTNASFEVADTLLGSRTVPDLANGTGSSGATTLTIPSSAAAGVAYLIARADADGAVAESQETNNTKSRTVSIGPDLIVTVVSVSSSIVPAGAAINITDTVMNQGADTAAPTITRFYLSNNSLLDAGDAALEPGRAVFVVAPGASSSGSTPVTIPLGTVPGSYYVLAKADGDAAVGESLETNNVLTRAIQVTAAP